MPPKEAAAAANGTTASTSDAVAVDNTRDLPLAYTSFYAPPPVNVKNVASQYLRTETQSWTGRNPLQLADGVAALRNKQKKRKLNVQGDATPMSDAIEESEDEDESAQQQGGVPSTASHTIVINPGSRYLRIGLASDLAPISVPHTIARRDASRASKRRGAASEADKEAEDETTDGSAKRSDDLTQSTDALRNDLKSIMRNMKLRPVANGRQQTANYNASVKPEKLQEHQDVFAIDWTKSSDVKADVLLGEKAERLDVFSSTKKDDEEKSWTRFQPFLGGHLNYKLYAEHYGEYTAHHAIVKDIVTIWSHAIEAPKDLEKESVGQVVDKGLGIPASDRQYYNVVLVIPDLYLLAEVEILVTLLIEDMGFAAVMVQQQSVCATFGAGLSSACVIHVGSERTSVACVDEGLVIADSRTSLAYGGEQISAYFTYLLQRANFPYAKIDVDRRLADQWLANELKERLCTLDPTQMGLIINEFYVRIPRQATCKYSLRTYDEVIVGPMCLFNTRAIPFADKKAKLLPLSTTQLITDDEADETEAGSLPVTLAMTNCVRHLLPVRAQTPPATDPSVTATNTTAQPTAEGSKQGTPAPPPSTTSKPEESGGAGTRVNELAGQKDDGSAVPSQRTSPVPSTTNNKQSTANGVKASNGAPSTSLDATTVDIVYEASKVALDWAVWNSILASVSSISAPAQAEERMKRLATNMFCTGGTALMPGLGMAIEARVHNYLSQWYTQQGKDMATLPTASVVPPPRDMDPRVVTWKGIAVLSRLDSAQDMWIGRQEWKIFGMRALREKVIFM